MKSNKSAETLAEIADCRKYLDLEHVEDGEARRLFGRGKPLVALPLGLGPYQVPQDWMVELDSRRYAATGRSLDDFKAEYLQQRDRRPSFFVRRRGLGGWLKSVGGALSKRLRRKPRR